MRDQVHIRKIENGFIVREPRAWGEEEVFYETPEKLFAGILHVFEGFDARDKVVTIHPAIDYVRLVRGEWNEAYLQELERFPMGAHDDQVDASSASYNALALEPEKPRGGTWGRR